MEEKDRTRIRLKAHCWRQGNNTSPESTYSPAKFSSTTSLIRRLTQSNPVRRSSVKLLWFVRVVCFIFSVLRPLSIQVLQVSDGGNNNPYGDEELNGNPGVRFMALFHLV